MSVFAEEIWLLSLLALPLLALAGWRIEARRRSRLRRMIDPGLHARLVRAPSRSARRLRLWTVLAALGLVGLSLARPQGAEIEQEAMRIGRDVVFVVDVSRSMLAEDLAPTRLERAKQIVLDGLGAMRGERVGLVAFAGSAVLKCPLTTDTGFARLTAQELDADSAARGGSLIGDALRLVDETLFDEAEPRLRDVVLITDGEDHGSFPVEAAAALGEKGARLIAIGLGSPAGAPVPAPSGGVMTYEGEPVISSLRSDQLERMARATEGGVYLPVGDGYIEFDRVYRGLARAAEAGETETVASTRRAELFQLPLGAALLLLTLERTLRDRR